MAVDPARRGRVNLREVDFASDPTERLRNPVQGGHPFQRKADSNPVIADSR